jgi:hypothetical protein
MSAYYIMSNTLEYVFGCRSPSSKYARDGAIVVLKQRGDDTIVISEFLNGADYIGHPTYEEALAVYHKHINILGWRRMDVDDLDNTAIDRDQIDERTVLDAPLAPLTCQTCSSHSGTLPK